MLGFGRDWGGGSFGSRRLDMFREHRSPVATGANFVVEGTVNFVGFGAKMLAG